MSKLLPIPPQSIEAEESLLNTIIKDNDVILDIVEIVQPEDFYSPANKLIFQSILKLHEKSAPIDLVTIINDLKKNKTNAKKAGGAAYLAKLDSAPVAVDPKHYAKLIYDKSVLRKMISDTAKISKKCFEDIESTDDILDFAEQSIFDISKKERKKSFSKISDLLSENIDILVKRKENKKQITGISSGFTDLDKITAGFQAGDLIILAARPSMGKTALALNIARNATVYNNSTIAFFSLEMPKSQLAIRLLASESKIDFNKLKSGFYSNDDFKTITNSATILSEYPIYIDDSVDISAMEIRSKVRRLALEQNGKELGLIVIDYIQLMKTTGNLERRELEIASISKSLKNLAKELKVPILALSQLNRMLEQRKDKRPMLSDLRESGALEQDADLVIFVFRDDIYKEKNEPKDGKAEVIVSKHRNGPLGTVNMNFLSSYTLFQSSSENFYEN